MKHIFSATRILAYSLTAMLLIFLCSCGQKANAPSETLTPSEAEPSPAVATQSVPSPLGAYQSVLQNNADFFSTDVKRNLNMSQLNQTVSDDSSVRAKAAKFAVVDLDNDGTPELILWLNVNDDDYYGFEVLRYQDGMVYGYTLWYRAFMELKADGTFSFSSGAADNGFGTISFTDDTYSIDMLAHCEGTSYVVNGESATEEEFQSAVHEQDGKADAEWYDFTEGNIEAVLDSIA